MKTKVLYRIQKIGCKPYRVIVYRLLTGVFCWLALLSCERLLEVDPPSTLTATDQVFSDDATAETAVRGMYADMVSNHVFSGNQNSVLALAGLSSDELFHPPGTNIEAVQFQENILQADNQLILSLWDDIYRSVYSANVLTERLEASTGLTTDAREEFIGEALFVRAFCHFYLVNLFGEVPLVTTTDYQANAVISRTGITEVYEQVVEDLLIAIEFLDPAYPDDERVRPNRGAAMALLARVYLYLGNWTEAEKWTTEVINDSNYRLVELNSITLSNNEEAIWQLHSSSPTVNAATQEGNSFNVPSSFNALREEMVEAFEPGDLRKMEWIRLDASSFYAPFKYKVTGSGTDRSEYSTILRLAEQYLIRAEARTQQNKLIEAIADLDSIRGRAGLPLLAEIDPEIGQSELLDVIIHERRVELFSEWGHRWLDLKRTGQADTVLSLLKSEFTSEDKLYPIPQQELNNNPNLRQNVGY
ncbi:RagB/SusD family nutrient uptake outer membrane protein [Sinomicrobium weinanense]|uniref:RagB/SusD family nutrient uptake outer membrane protein n=1 Tax=Sinomicrobium weinanense TaxID=2842200 RepID=A0A926JUF0_9FLAO|nr:RagB/SusD family nutrient uptake outer membrane protein [Sinomicrobium weinanense]MBC9797717.1 RagB/SusD family nutrient uptake outer membrane protein [Sinomicrobium weinanense]MBU3122257.1 RagB/SusD family nutrient uptake outer membrane protein [Sinomicrobium weinanense]